MGDGTHDIEFNFENESLRHKISNTMRETMYEVSRELVNNIWPIYVS